MTIKAPFNFVKVSEDVFTPSWARIISQDVPFSDGESGTIDLKITAESPIFVRNGHTLYDKEHSNERYKSFSNSNKRFFIPGTSLKGSIRNVLEIISFSKMRIDPRMKFATRDYWFNAELYNLKADQDKIHCGWLRLNDEQAYVEDCGKPLRINHKRLDEFFINKKINISFEKIFSKDSDVDLKKEEKINGKPYDRKTSVYKYALIGNQLEELKNLDFNEDFEYNNDNQDNRVVFSSVPSTINGTIVFTGSPDKWVFHRHPKGGKFYEFVFPNITDPNPIPISENDFIHFKFFHSDSEDWKFWSDILNKGGEVPIFFRIEQIANNTVVKDFGLAYLYKIPYKYSPLELLSDDHKNNESPDLAECIFGFTKKESSLKGRVQFSHAFAKINSSNCEEVRLVLGSPKASYYPIYVDQEPEGVNGKTKRYNTYSDEGKSIAGWKRYPVRADVINNQTGNDKLDSKLIPLPKGSEFESKIRFHNLRKVEIGALLSALTFHGNNEYYHVVGGAKPYGYGKVKLEVSLNGTNYKLNDYLIAFEKELVEGFLKGKLEWHSSEQISQLYTMSYDYNAAATHLLQYMKLKNDKGENEFLIAKGQNHGFKEYLERYNKLVNSKRQPKSLYEEERESIQRQKELEKTQIEEEETIRKIKRERELEEIAKNEAIKRKEERAKDADKIFLLDDFDYSSRDAWKNLIKMVEKYSCILHKDNNYPKLVKMHPEGLVPTCHHKKILDTILQIKSNLGNKERIKWEAPYELNPFIKKLAEWIGKDNISNLK